MVRQIAKRFLGDEAGVVSVVDILLIGAIAGIGMLVGLATFRDQLVLHFNDAALSLGSLNQSYSVTVGGVTSSYADPGPFPATSPVEFVDSDTE